MAEGVDGSTARRVVVTSAVRYIIPTEISGYFRILDLERERVTFLSPLPESTWRDADPNPRGGTRGARGVSVHGGRIVLANAERLFVLDRSWRLLAELSDRLMSDVHDVLAEERGIWVAATGCDMLLLVRWDGRLEHAWSLRRNRKLLKQLGFRKHSLPAIDPGIDFRDPRARGEGFERLHVNSLGRGPAGLLVSLGRVAAELEPVPELSSVLAGVTEGARNGSPHVSILHRQTGTAAPNHNVGEEGDLLVYNDSNRHCLVAYDRTSRSERCAVAVPGEPSFARGLARIGPNLWLVGSQAPLAVHAVDLARAEVVGSFPLGGVQDETVYAICVLPDEFDDPRQPLGADPYEFWRRAGASAGMTPVRV